MIIRYKGEEYIVICIYWKETNEKKQNWLYCWNLEKAFIKGINFFEAEIIDGKIPPNMCLNKSREENDNRDLIGWSLDLENNEIIKNSDWFWNGLCENEPKANLLLHRVINEIKSFHNLPLDNLSDLEKAARKQEDEENNNYKESEEERRKRELDEELDEYLRIGEEIEKER